MLKNSKHSWLQQRKDHTYLLSTRLHCLYMYKSEVLVFYLKYFSCIYIQWMFFFPHYIYLTVRVLAYFSHLDFYKIKRFKTLFIKVLWPFSVFQLLISQVDVVTRWRELTFSLMNIWLNYINNICEKRHIRVPSCPRRELWVCFCFFFIVMIILSGFARYCNLFV